MGDVPDIVRMKARIPGKSERGGIGMRTRTRGLSAGVRVASGSAVLLLLLIGTMVAPLPALGVGANAWTPQISGTAQVLEAVDFVDANTGYAVGTAGTILKTTNGGVSWTPQVSGVTTLLNCVHFYDANTGWAVGNGGVILKTWTGGATWTPQDSGTTNSLMGVYFAGPSTGWVVGAGGVILKTVNSGTTWTPQDSTVNSYLNAVHFESSTLGWVVGANGVILKTTNGGALWTPQVSGTIQTLRSVSITDATFQIGTIVGDSGVILDTDNGGSPWTLGTVGSSSLYSVVRHDASMGWAVGANGTILKTTTGGDTWQPQVSGTTKALVGLCAFDIDNLWAVGDSGTILKGMHTTPTTITIKTAATSTYHRKTVTLSGTVTPYSMIGRNIVVWVKKPGKGYYSYSSNRTSYLLNGGAAWLYKYYFKPTMATGIYYFKASAPAPGFWSSTGYLTSTSPVVTIRLR